MAVSLIGSPDVQILPGQMDPRYPFGSWSSDLSLTGDATAGNVIVAVRFRASTDPPLFLAFSLEYLTAQRRDAVDEDIMFAISGFSRGGVDGSQLRVDGMLDALVGDSAVASIPWPMMEIFLGNPLRGSNADIAVQWATNTDTVVYNLRAAGKLWVYDGAYDIGGPQPVASSVPTISGPSRPVGSLQEVRSGAVGAVSAAPTRGAGKAVEVKQEPTGAVSAGSSGFGPGVIFVPGKGLQVTGARLRRLQRARARVAARRQRAGLEAREAAAVAAGRITPITTVRGLSPPLVRPMKGRRVRFTEEDE